ncbi:MAG: methyltransferase domain-containing protein [Cyanobacteriota bacterium]
MPKDSLEYTQLQTRAAKCLAQNNYEEAIALYEQCVEMNSTEVSNYWYLGLALLLNGQELEAQASWLSILVEASSEEIDNWSQELRKILELKALHQQEVGNSAQAERIYWQILEQNPNYAQIYLNLAEVLIAQGKIDEAVALWKRIFEIELDCPEVQEELRCLLKNAKEKLGDNQASSLPIYRPEVFSVSNLEEAKAIILTPGQDTSTEERWIKETPYLLEQLGQELQPNSDDLILDYGCGVGRLAKEIIAHYGCTILGVDISSQMLQLASDYVGSQKFITSSPDALERMVCKGLRVDHAYSTWVIQHCLDPHTEIKRIKQALKPGGRFYIVNSHHRCVPSDKGWVNDGIQVAALLRREFQEVNYSVLPETVTTSAIAQHCFCMTLQNSAS